ncbi:hypothetical protein ACFVAJ_16495 [Agromyces sp. NPDC057679]|uniref:hypothetical protein n=1 Tax=Agromyces sp. NPDC057679 TaxID=3346207 RepID=UPI0036717C89
MTTQVDRNQMLHQRDGRYAGKVQTGADPEVLIKLNNKGSFLYPQGPFHTLRAYVDYWADVEIPDRILGNIALGYREYINLKKQIADFDWRDVYDRANQSALTSGNDRKVREAHTVRDAAYNAHTEKFWEDHPEHIRTVLLREVAIAGQVAWCRSLLPADIQDQALEVRVSLLDEELSVDEVCERYELFSIRGSFEDPEITNAEKLDKVRAELDRLSSGLSA